MCDIICTICLIRYGKVIHMEPRSGFFICPKCKVELWPKDINFVSRWEKERQHNLQYRSMSLQEGEQIKSGGGNNHKGHGKKKTYKRGSFFNANFEAV